MMNAMRTKLTRKTILQALSYAKGFPLLEESLRPHVDALCPPPTTDEEWKGHIDWLTDESRGAIVKVASAADEELVQWAITDRGRVMLASL